MIRILTLFALIASALPAQETATSSLALTTRESPRYDLVLAISVDGLRSDALLAGGSEELPHFYRLMNEGVGTLNARTDPDFQVTLPNHTSMLTGRHVTAGATAHNWTGNSLAPEGTQLLLPDSKPMPGMFDDCATEGIRTALFAGKPKFALFNDSWHPSLFMVAPCEKEEDVIGQQNLLTHNLLMQFDSMLNSPLEQHKRNLIFLHYLGPDVAGHMHHWNLTNGSAYRLSVQEVDRQLGKIFKWLDAHPEIRNRTAILLTSDHGGGSPANNHHGNPRMWINYIIPFLTWCGDAAKVGTLRNNDLYAINAKVRKDPSLSNPHGIASGLPPIRNGEIANLARMLMGLPSVKGSPLNFDQGLRILPN